MSQCVTCTRDLQDGYACHSCVKQLVEDLWVLAWLASELKVTETRQDCLADGLGQQTSGSPPSFNISAATALMAIHNMLVGWVRIFGTDGNWPADTPVAMALWLAHESDRLRNHAAVDALANDVKRHSESALGIINPAPDEQTYGVCGEEDDDGTPCEAYLYGDARADWVRCQKCDTQHDARKRMADLERRLRSMYFRPATLARLLPRLTDRPVSASNIRNWVREGKPIRTLVDDDGFQTCNTGDTADVAKCIPKRERPSKKAG